MSSYPKTQFYDANRTDGSAHPCAESGGRWCVAWTPTSSSAFRDLAAFAAVNGAIRQDAIVTGDNDAPASSVVARELARRCQPPGTAG